MLGHQQYQLSETFCNESDKCNKELAEAVHPYSKWLIIVLNNLSLVILVISRWKPWIVKYCFHFALLRQMVEETLPIDYGVVDMEFGNITIGMFFLHFSFSYWREIAHTIFLNYATVICREYLYND